MNTPGDYRNIYDNVNVEIEASVAWVTLNRPSKRNAISPALSADMLEVLRDLNADPEVRVLVLTGAGKSFCAGMDLKAFARGEVPEFDFLFIDAASREPSAVGGKGERVPGAMGIARFWFAIHGLKLFAGGDFVEEQCSVLAFGREGFAVGGECQHFDIARGAETQRAQAGDGPRRQGITMTIAERFGIAIDAPIEPPTIDEIALRAPRVSPPDSLAHLFTTDPEERAGHTYGKSFRDVWRGLHRDFSQPPDLVAVPRDEHDIASLLDWCSDARIAAIPA